MRELSSFVLEVGNENEKADAERAGETACNDRRVERSPNTGPFVSRVGSQRRNVT